MGPRYGSRTRRGKHKLLHGDDDGGTGSGSRKSNVESRRRFSGRLRMKPWLHFILKAILPPGMRERQLKRLSRYRGDSLGLIKESAYAVLGGYRYNTVQSFNKHLVAAELGVIIFCFGA